MSGRSGRGGPQFIHSMCEGAAGSVSAIRREAGQQLVDRGACVHMLSTA